MVYLLKGIADYVSSTTGHSFSEEAARKAIKRAGLPVETFNGRYRSRTEWLDEWIAKRTSTNRIESA